MKEVMVNDSFSPKDILCLQYDGIKPSQIMTSGLDIVHPKENAPLQQRILNRLQAALSSTVILAECPQKSGSKHTMRFARKYHKRCLVVSYPEYSCVNAGNELLINSNLAKSI